ncbi:MAG: zinc ribbon domain-containing protein [Clostridia bacterium]|nr:zinc ribbon domain-containing protein [Clostridia bacterium]
MEFMKKVEEISRKVGDTATDAYNTVADKSGKLIEETKLKISISEKQTDIDEIYEEIGKAVYNAYKSGEDVGKEFTKQAKKIDKLNEEIAEMNKKILYNKGLRTCESCAEVIPLDSKFCINCGKKQKAVKLKEEKKEIKKENVEVEKVCPECGQVFEPTAKFCNKCGHQF